MSRNPWLSVTAGLTAVTLAVAGCGTSGNNGGADDEGSGAGTELALWTHAAGNEQELALIQAQVAAFNDSQEDWEVVIEQFPQESYNDSVVAGALAGDLPCILDMDGPITPNWAWAQYIQPIEVPQERLDAWLPSATATFQDELYGIGNFEVAVGMYARKSVLDGLGIRIPTMDQPWTLDEFNGALASIKDSGDFEYALELGTSGTGEWWPYAFSPFLQSFGGDLIDRDTMLTAEGALNGPEALAWGEWWQGLFEQGYVQKKELEDSNGFVEGRVPLKWDGNWGGADALEQWGDDALFLPPPDLGTGPKTGGQSWMTGVSATCEHTEGAMAYIQSTLSDENMAAYAEAISLIPVTQAAAEMTTNYKTGGPLKVFEEISRQFAVIRPPTPAYPVISTVFEKAAMDIRDGADVKATLDQAVSEIDADIQANGGYGF
jgi:multiple sugar transport system substrate-binding protein